MQNFYRHNDMIYFIPLQMGAYHTLDLEVNRKFTLGKQEWDSIALERIGMYWLTAKSIEWTVGKIWWFCVALI